MAQARASEAQQTSHHDIIGMLPGRTVAHGCLQRMAGRQVAVVIIVIVMGGSVPPQKMQEASVGAAAAGRVLLSLCIRSLL